MFYFSWFSFWIEVAALRCAMAFRSFYMIIEQPKGSHMYNLPQMKSLLESRAMHRHLTYMGYWATR